MQFDDAYGPADREVLAQEFDTLRQAQQRWWARQRRALACRLPGGESDPAMDAWFGPAVADPLRQHLVASPLWASVLAAHQGLLTRLTAVKTHLGAGGDLSPADFDALEGLAQASAMALASVAQSLGQQRHPLDTLTGLPGRGSALDHLRREQRRHGARQAACVVALGDIDHFKRINDTFGHAAGDAVLTAVAQCLRTGLRGDDRVFRYGGEEFVISLAQISLADAVGVVDRLRQQVAQLRVPGAEMPVTMSFGLALLTPGTVESALAVADARLYGAKHAGRNCVVSQD